MMEIGIALASLFGGYVVDRLGYNRKISAMAAKIAPALPNATITELAERAIIAANYRELAKQVEKQKRQAADHAARMSKIDRGE